MPGLLSGSVSRTGGSGQFISLPNAQPQLPPTPTTATGFTVVTDSQLVTSYASSLGYLQFTTGTITNQIPGRNIVLAATGTSTVVVSNTSISYSTVTGALVVAGGIGVSGGLYSWTDIHVNGLTIGQGYQGKNNIVLRGTPVPQTDNYNNGQESIAIGYDTLNGINTSLKVIALGRYAVSSGTNVSNTIAIGDSALKQIGIKQTQFIGTVTNAFANGYTYTYNTVTQVINFTPVALIYPTLTTGTSVLTIPNHGLSTGTLITINYSGEPTVDVPADNQYYVSVLNTNTVALYTDVILSIPDVLSDDLPFYNSSTVFVYYQVNNNIAVGTNAGAALINGTQNFFVGDNAAPNFTTGSYNYFFGPDVAQNITHGNAIIAIGSDNLVDGVDNQINIGSVFYYDGYGYLQLNADVGLGLGYVATSTQDAALAVLGGVGISENIIVGSLLDSTATTNGALLVAGGAGIGGSVFIGGGLNVTTGNKNVNLSPVGGNVIIEPTIGGTVTIYPNAIGSMENMNIGLNVAGNSKFVTTAIVSTITSTSTTTGALTVTGGVGIGGTMYVGGLITGSITTATNLTGGARGSLPYQASTGTTTFLSIGANNNILVSDGTVPYWTSVNSLLSNTTTNASNVFVNTATTATYYLGLTESIGTYSKIDSTPALTYNNVIGQLKITSTATSTSTTTGALVVGGGVGVKGSIYSADGSEGDNYLVYVPKIYISTTPPPNARIGEFWIEPNSGVEFQYILDGTNKIWIQFAGL
jgi:hypothetical protein